MAGVQITPGFTMPGEAAVVAIANMISELARGQTPEQKKILWDRFIDLTHPWHALAVEASKDTATFIAEFLKAIKGGL